MRLRLTIAALTPLLFGSPPAAAQPPNDASAARAEVLVLGVYHMANPGRDLFNTRTDDVLAPKRQAEIAELITVLKRFRPTKIAVEAGFADETVAKRYADYLAGKHELSRNETEQIGFRLAKELGHQKVHQVDVDGEFPFPRLADYAKAHARQKELDTLMTEVGDWVKATSAFLASHSVLETLLFINSDEHAAQGVGFYYRQAHLGEPWNWAGPDLVADWFRRNIRIYGNVVRLVDGPSERILVIYGSGHLGWLRQNFADDPTIRLRKLAEFVR
ncbi:MAG TPA: DUF5694 domain-containing protein [Gemmatimonadaceae bacterium]|nr:DUF5694 domain-containing protein [Gemmatimonadaceae bacterium]